MKLYIICLFALFMLVIPVSASTELIELPSTTYYTGNAGTGNVYSQIWITGIDIDSVSNVSLDASTYTLNATFSNANALTCDIDAVFYDKMTGNTTYYSDTWYHFSVYDAYLMIGSEDDVSGPVGGSFRFIHYFPETVAYAPDEFIFTSDGPVDLALYRINYEETVDFTYSSYILDIIDKVPIVGTYIVDALKITGSIVSTFFSYAVFIIDNWAIILMAFETFVLLRATTLLQGRGKQSKKISKAITQIASDNKKMIEFVVAVSTKIIELVYSAVRAIGEWIPFT